MLTYAAIGMAYTFYLKTIPILDIAILAGLYVCRIFMGAVVCGITIPSNIYLASACFFFSLANMKRVVELGLMKGGKVNIRRGYLQEDRPLLMSLGTFSGLATCIFYTQYILMAPRTNEPLLWVITALIAGWFSYVWLLSWRGRMHSDPVKFAIKDPVSHFFFVTGIFAWLLAPILS
jgi:4-hydroxybenzoate polyprenyltransferase